MFQLDKLTVIVAEKPSCPIRLRGVIISGVTDSYIGMSASHVQLQKIQEAVLAQRDRATRCVSQYLVNCSQLSRQVVRQIHNKIAVMELEGYS